MIHLIHINNFRNHANLRITVPDDRRMVVLYGENGIGKTNVLEAISLFFTSNGLRKAKYDDLICRDMEQNHWNIRIEVNAGTFFSGYIRDNNLGKRIYKINEKSIRNLEEFQKEHYILWMTYETDRLFMQAPSYRRDFIDMFCNVVNQAHAQNIKDYEKLTKERLKILKKYCERGIIADISKWLDILEAKIADFGLQIASERSRMASTLEQYQIRSGEFPLFKSQMIGGVETEILKSDNSIEAYKIELCNRRQKDGFAGATTLGANRSDWLVTHEEKHIEASQCSAGEQKMLILAIFFAFILHNIKNDKRSLIILLDDVVTHLDTNHRNLLSRYIKTLISQSSNISVWLTGTDKEPFNELSMDALFIDMATKN